MAKLFLFIIVTTNSWLLKCYFRPTLSGSWVGKISQESNILQSKSVPTSWNGEASYGLQQIEIYGGLWSWQTILWATFSFLIASFIIFSGASDPVDFYCLHSTCTNLIFGINCLQCRDVPFSFLVFNHLLYWLFYCRSLYLYIHFALIFFFCVFSRTKWTDSAVHKTSNGKNENTETSQLTHSSTGKKKITGNPS